LCRTKRGDAVPEWLSYSFDESKPLKLKVKRRRLAGGGDVDARCLLVRAENKWLIATVAPGFEGHELVGRLLAIDKTASPTLVEQVRKEEPKLSGVRPFEFNAVDGSASDQHERYSGAAVLGGAGLLGILLGSRLVRAKRKKAASATP
jgi:hypothetical protein